MSASTSNFSPLKSHFLFSCLLLLKVYTTRSSSADSYPHSYPHFLSNICLNLTRDGAPVVCSEMIFQVWIPIHLVFPSAVSELRLGRWDFVHIENLVVFVLICILKQGCNAGMYATHLCNSVFMSIEIQLVHSLKTIRSISPRAEYNWLHAQL